VDGTAFNYQLAFDRNLGLLTDWEQQALSRQARRHRRGHSGICLLDGATRISALDQRQDKIGNSGGDQGK
jgi:hypothetical protein